MTAENSGEGECNLPSVSKCQLPCAWSAEPWLGVSSGGAKPAHNDIDHRQTHQSHIILRLLQEKTSVKHRSRQARLQTCNWLPLLFQIFPFTSGTSMNFPVSSLPSHQLGRPGGKFMRTPLRLITCASCSCFQWTVHLLLKVVAKHWIQSGTTGA